MSEDDLKKVFSRNLNRIMAERDVQAADITNDLKIASSTVSNWCTGLKMPRAGSIDALARYLSVSRSDLLSDTNRSHYINPETQAMAEKIYQDKNLRLLFSAAEDATAEDLQLVHDMLKRLKQREQGYDA